MKKHHLVVNYIWMEGDGITVGVTDSERWAWDIEDGMSGADAKTLMCVILKDNGPRYTKTETVDIGCLYQSEHRALCLRHIDELSVIARTISEKELDMRTARATYFGQCIGLEE